MYTELVFSCTLSLYFHVHIELVFSFTLSSYFHVHWARSFMYTELVISRTLSSYFHVHWARIFTYTKFIYVQLSMETIWKININSYLYIIYSKLYQVVSISTLVYATLAINLDMKEENPQGHNPHRK